MSVSIRFAGAAAAAVVALGGGLSVSAASADDTSTTPCAQQQAKVEKAEAALVRVTAVFERQQARVAKAKKVVAAAEAGREKAQARRLLADAKQDRKKTKVTKRAQQQRLAKAQERLTECEIPEPTETATPA